MDAGVDTTSESSVRCVNFSYTDVFAESGANTLCVGNPASCQWLRAGHQRPRNAVLPGFPLLIHRYILVSMYAPPCLPPTFRLGPRRVRHRDLARQRAHGRGSRYLLVLVSPSRRHPGQLHRRSAGHPQKREAHGGPRRSNRWCVRTSRPRSCTRAHQLNTICPQPRWQRIWRQRTWSSCSSRSGG